MRERTRWCLRLTATVLATGLLASCQALGGSGHGDTGPSTPPLSDVNVLDDPHSWEGPSTAVAPTAPIHPVTAGEQKLPVTLTDTQGTEVTITDASRILALDIYGSLSRIVYELGLGENLVGRDISSGFPEVEDLPIVTQNGHDLNAEAMLELHPTVIITDTSLGPWDTILQMRQLDIPVVVVEPRRSLDSIDTLINEIAEALGVPERGTELAAKTTESVDNKIAQIAKVAPQDSDDKLRMIFLYVRGNSGVYYLFGEESGADTLIKALGGIDIAGENGWKGMRPVTAEALVAANPDVILMMSEGLKSVDGVDGLITHIPAVGETTAGKKRRIVDMSDTTILSFGPQSAEVLDALAVAIYAPEEAGTR